MDYKHQKTCLVPGYTELPFSFVPNEDGRHAFHFRDCNNLPDSIRSITYFPLLQS